MSDFPEPMEDTGDRIPEPPPQSPAAAELDAGFAALDSGLLAVSDQRDEWFRLANTRFMGSIAVSLYELTQLLATEEKS